MIQENEIWIYTDGACSGNPGPGGWAYLIGDLTQVFSVRGADPKTTNNRMELIASIESLKALKNFKTNSKPHVNLFTDSSYVSQGITSWIHGWKKRDWTKSDNSQVMNVDLWKALDEAHQEALNLVAKIDWKLVPGHEGVAGNEWVDQECVASSKDLQSESKEWKYKDFPEKDIFESAPRLRESKSSSKSSKSSKTSKGSSSGKSSGPAIYVSILKGEIQKHKTWSECEARVKGQSGAKFKKVKTEFELNEWLNKYK